MAAKQHKTAARRNAPTAAQRSAWSDFGQISLVWARLTEEQRHAWTVAARADRRGRRAGRRRRPCGQRLFMKVNLRRNALGLDLLPDPAGSDGVKALPLVRFFITNIGGRIALKLMVTQGSAEGVMLSSWRPCSAGRMAWYRFIRLGLVPAAVRGVRDFTKLYVAKFGVPPAGSKIFLHLRQMNDYRGSMVQTISAMVPAGSRPVGGVKGD